MKREKFLMANFQKWPSKLVSADIETVKAVTRRSVRFVAYSTRIPKYLSRARFKSEKDVLFVWIPKSAGTSIYNWLNEEIGMLKLKEPFAVRGGFPAKGPATFGHMDLVELMNKGWVDADYLETAFSFAIVRNPYSRARSLFTYLKKRYRLEHDFTAFLELVAQGVEPVGLYNSVGLSQANPQCRWIKNPVGSTLVDEFWKLEELETALPSIRSKTGASNAPGMLNKSSSRIVEMSARDIALIQDIYQEDFETFGYSSNPITGKGT